MKRSLSNTDVSDLTSILIKDLPQEYFDKKLLEREFAIFGANKVSLQPTKQSIVVNFATHVSAILSIELNTRGKLAMATGHVMPSQACPILGTAYHAGYAMPKDLRLDS